MPSYKYRELTRAIQEKLGISLGGKERTGWFYMDGKKVARVTIPHVHRGDVKPGTLNSIRKQVHLDNEQFAALIDCPLKGSDYVTILKEKGLI